jgi:DNA polymerase-3 subunit beta
MNLDNTKNINQNHISQNITKNNNEEINFICKKTLFQKSLQIFQSILEKKSLIPIFNNLKINIYKNIICLSGMNLDIAAINEFPIINLLYKNKDEENIESEFLINGHFLYDIVRKITDEEIIIKKNNNNNFIEIFAGNFFCKLSLQENEKFPKIDTLENNLLYYIKANILSDAMDSVLCCASVNDSRNFLCAIKIIQDINQKSIEFIATDTHRMAYIKAKNINFSIDKNNKIINDNKLEEITNNYFELILPRKTAVFILKFLKEMGENNIYFKISDQKIIFLFNDSKEESSKVQILSKIYDGKYPNFKKLLNIKYNLKFQISLKKIIESIDRALILLDEKNSKVLNLEIEAKKNKITVISQSDDRGMIKDVIDNIKFIDNNDQTHEKIIINMNAYYLYEILKSIKASDIIFAVNDAKSPIALSNLDFDNKFYLLMPMII